MFLFWDIVIYTIGFISAFGWCLYAYDNYIRLKEHEDEIKTNHLSYHELHSDQ